MRFALFNMATWSLNRFGFCSSVKKKLHFIKEQIFASSEK
jgi:hypothetical protein